MGHEVSLETRAGVSAAHKGKRLSLETRAKMSAANWKGGPKISSAKKNSKRRTFGFVALNSWFSGCEGHHVDKERVIYLPKALHRSVYHRQTDARGMAKMNAIAYNWLFKQEVETVMMAKEATNVQEVA